MRRVSLLLIVLALAGCGAAQQAASCVTQPLASARLEMAPLPSIQATIAGLPVRLVIDTGAIRSLLTPEAAARLRLQRDRFVGEHVIGISGQASYAWNAITDRITIGGVAFPEREMGVAPIAIPADGLLGGDFWRRYDLELDYPDARVEIDRASLCRRVVAPWGGPAAMVDGLADSPPGRLLLPAKLDGLDAVGVFDTGAQISAVAIRLAQRLPPPKSGWRVAHIRGVNSPSRTMPARAFAELRVGGIVLADHIMPIVPIQPGIADMILGEDLIRGCRTWISFAAHQLFVAITLGDVLPCRPAGR